MDEARRLAVRSWDSGGHDSDAPPGGVGCSARRTAPSGCCGTTRTRSRGGDFRSLGRAAFALAHPAVGTDRMFELLGRDAAWVAEAERWLQRFAATVDSERSVQ